MNKDQLILDWKEKKSALDKAKKEEAAAREEVISNCLQGKEEGTETLELGNHWKLKAQYNLRYTLDNKDNAVNMALEHLPENVAKHLIDWKPSLRKSEYDRLSQDEKRIIDTVLTIKPGMPTLTLVEPKG